MLVALKGLDQQLFGGTQELELCVQPGLVSCGFIFVNKASVYH